VRFGLGFGKMSDLDVGEVLLGAFMIPWLLFSVLLALRCEEIW
jgi:hypothetical protein